jgi:hypothetical protein
VHFLHPRTDSISHRRRPRGGWPTCR